VNDHIQNIRFHYITSGPSLPTSNEEVGMIDGLWLPIVTPFRDGAVDFKSYERLIEHYLALGIDALFPLGTTGESPTLDEAETDELVERTLATVAGRVPVFVGVGGNATAKVEKDLKRLERHAFAGIVSVCPYYNRPSQDGLIAHFRAVAAATDRDVLIYNIPYRTAVNLSNDSLIELAEVSNIVGVKDSSGSIAQSLDLLARKPTNVPGGLLGADRRGRALFHHDGQRRRGRHPGGEPRHDRTLHRGRASLRRQRRRRRAPRLGAARVGRAAAVRRGQPDADQAPAVAAGPDRLAGVPPAADEDLRRAGAAARSAGRRTRRGGVRPV
jgi:hypothetical protein